MNNKNRVLLLVVFALMSISLVFAQTTGDEEQYTVEQLQELIREQKQAIREAAKIFLVDELPVIASIDPDRAIQELDNFLSMLNTMTDTEVMYLLGHMYAREGEDDKAITMFDSVLRTNMDESAREMLNLVLYRRLITLLDQGNEAAAKDFLRAIVFENYNASPYFPAYLYLFSDISADSENYEEIISLVQAYNENREIVLNLLLPARDKVLAKLNALDMGSYFENPNQQNFNSINADIDQILRDITALNNQIISMKGMVYVNEIQSIHDFETKNLNDLKQLLLKYANAQIKTNQAMSVADGHIAAAKASIGYYDAVLRKFDEMLQNRYQRLLETGSQSEVQNYTADLYLDKLIQTDRTISIYAEILDGIDYLLTQVNDAQQRQMLLDQRTDTVQKKADLEVRRQQYLAEINYPDETERTIFMELLGEYNALLADKRQLELTARELEDYVYTEVRTILNEEVRGDIRPQISSILSSVSDPSARHQVFTQGFNDGLDHLEFITLQMSYRDLMSDFNVFQRNQMTLPDEERVTMQTEFRREQLDLIDDMSNFLMENPRFSAINQPGGGNLAEAADLYYNLGELQYYAIPQDLSPALASYRKALELDPNLPDRDLALYNIAFIASELKRAEIDRNRISYRETATINSTPPANAIYNESNFAETLAALQEIVSRYPESQVYEESIYRLGLLHFRFAEDSTSPVAYRNTAIGYFDQIIAKPDSPLYYDAIYQRGWVRLNSYEHEDLRLAMNDFMVLLKAVEDGRITNPDLARDYHIDSVNNIAYCLIALDGTDFRQQSLGVAEIERLFAGYQNREVVRDVIDLATQNKSNMAARIQAADFLRYRISMFPMALENPSLLDSMLVLYANSSSELREGESLPQIIRSTYRETSTNYNYKSDWYKENKDKDILPQLSVVNKAYEQLGIMYYNDFATRRDREAMQSYITHMEQYGEFMQQFDTANHAKFQADNDSILVDFQAILAENSQSVADYLEAITKLRAYNDKYPENLSYFYNEQRSLFYAQRVYEISTQAMQEPGYAPVSGQPANADEAYSFLEGATMRFMETARKEAFATSENLNRAAILIVNLAEIQRERGKKDEAIALYNKALEAEQHLSASDKKDIYLRLAVMHSDADRFAEAESWFRKALPLAASAQEREDIGIEILVQIQNAFENASSQGDFTAEAAERLRFAAQLDPATQADEVLGQKYAAVEAYVNAKAYQQAIDLLVELSANEQDGERVYAWYNKAAGIAGDADKMNDPAKALSLEKDFIAKHPSSNYAFRLRMVHLKDAFNDPARANEAAEGYLQLFEDVQNRRTDSGDVAASSILNDAILAFVKSGNVTREYELRNRFISLYPNHENCIPFMEYMAKGHFDRNEMEDYNRLAKEIFRRDPSRNSLYLYAAQKHLDRIGTQFSQAYDNRDYQAAFGFRDEYLRVESQYKKEGLSVENEAAHTFFAAVKKEYDDIQKQKAYLASYDKQLNALAKSGLFTAAPTTHIKVNYATTWDKHLASGHNRLGAFRTKVQAEVTKVTTLISQANESGYFIDNDRRIKAIDLIAKINQRAITVVNAQVEKYFREAIEAQYYRDQYPGDQLNAVISNVASQQTQQYANEMVTWQFNMFRLYHLAGYHNPTIDAAVASLTEKGISLDYRNDEHILSSSWQQELVEGGSALAIRNQSTPNGTNLGMVSIPAQKTLRLSKSVSTPLAPDFAYLHLMYPMDVQIKLNGSVIDAEWIPVDTLTAGKPATTHYAVIIPGESFVAGANQIELEFANQREAVQDMAMNLHIRTSEYRIQQNIPPVVSTIHTNTTWRVITPNAETGEESSSFAKPASAWNITWDNIDGFAPSSATPIWVDETADSLVQTVILETEFDLESEFREGHIDFVAPDDVTIYLNGNRLSSATMDYDPDPLMIYALPIQIPANMVQMGKNTIRFEITNNSAYRGFLATITYARAGKEGIR